MKFIFTVISLIILLLFSGCNSKKEQEIVLDSKDLELQMIEAYKKGLEELIKEMYCLLQKCLMKQNCYILSQYGAKIIFNVCLFILFSKLL